MARPAGDTPRSPRIRLDGEVRQQQIVEAHANLIAHRGYAATSLRDVAAAAGISTGTLMHHFKTKDELLTATLLTVADGFMTRSAASIGRAKNPRAKLRSLVRDMFATSDEVDIGWKVWIAFWHEASLKPELAEVATMMTERSESAIARLIAEAVEAGQFAPGDAPKQRASRLAALIDGVAIRVYGEAGRWSHRRAIAVIDDFVDEWAARA